MIEGEGVNFSVPAEVVTDLLCSFCGVGMLLVWRVVALGYFVLLLV